MDRGLTPGQRRRTAQDLELLIGHDLVGRRFLDIGSGSGVHSIAALDLGADEVRAFDYDPDSVTTSGEVSSRLGDERWAVVEQGDILDGGYRRSLGTWDVVYSWGVLHHTGSMWDAIDGASDLVAPGGELVIAIYNDQGLLTRYWSSVKRWSARRESIARLFFALHWPYHVAARWVARTLRGERDLERGMRYTTDLRDWIGGWPFEAASVEAVVRFLSARGFLLRNVVTAGRRHGCNEFVFVRT